MKNVSLLFKRLRYISLIIFNFYFKKSCPVAICRTYLNGEDMYMSAMKGKGLKILHIYQDNVWALGDRTIPLPNIPITEEPSKSPELENKTNEETSKIEYKKESENIESIAKIEEGIEGVKIELQNEQASDESELQAQQNEKQAEIDHQKILTDGFLGAIKFKSKEYKLPVLVSTFMKTLQSCW